MRVELTVNFAGHKIVANTDVPDELLSTNEAQQYFVDLIRHRIEEKMKEKIIADAATEG